MGDIQERGAVGMGMDENRNGEQSPVRLADNYMYTRKQTSAFTGRHTTCNYMYSQVLRTAAHSRTHTFSASPLLYNPNKHWVDSRPKHSRDPGVPALPRTRTLCLTD